MLLEIITLIIVVAVVVAVVARHQPVPARVRRQPTRAELIAQLVAQRPERDCW